MLREVLSKLATVVCILAICQSAAVNARAGCVRTALDKMEAQPGGLARLRAKSYLPPPVAPIAAGNHGDVVLDVMAAQETPHKAFVVVGANDKMARGTVIMKDGKVIVTDVVDGVTTFKEFKISEIVSVKNAPMPPRVEIEAQLGALERNQIAKFEIQNGGQTRTLKGLIHHREGDLLFVQPPGKTVGGRPRALVEVPIDDIAKFEIGRAATVTGAPVGATKIFGASVTADEQARILAMQSAEATQSAKLANSRKLTSDDEILMLASDSTGPKKVKISHFLRGSDGTSIAVLDNGQLLPMDHIAEIGMGRNRPLIELRSKELARREKAAEEEVTNLPHNQKAPAPKRSANQAPGLQSHATLAHFGENAIFAKTGLLTDGRPVNNPTFNKGSSMLDPADGTQKIHVVDQVIVDQKEPWRIIGIKFKDGELKSAGELKDWGLVTAGETHAPGPVVRVKRRVAVATKSAPLPPPPAGPAKNTPPLPPRRRIMAQSPGTPAPELLVESTKRMPQPPPIPADARQVRPKVLPRGSSEHGVPTPVADEVPQIYKLSDGREIVPGKHVRLADQRGATIEKIIRADEGNIAFLTKVDGTEERVILHPDRAGSVKKATQAEVALTAKVERITSNRFDTISDEGPVTHPADVDFHAYSDGRIIEVGDNYPMIDGRRLTINRITLDDDGNRIFIAEIDGTGEIFKINPDDIISSKFKPHSGENIKRPKNETEFGRYAVTVRSAVTADGRLLRGGHGVAREEATFIKDANGTLLRVTQVVTDQNSGKLLGVRVGKGPYLFAKELKDYTFETWKLVPTRGISKVTDASGKVHLVDAVIVNEANGAKIAVRLRDNTTLDATDLKAYEIDITLDPTDMPRPVSRPKPLLPKPFPHQRGE